MRLVVVSHKPCWASADSPTGFETDGGFPLQMGAISELADETTILVPVVADEGRRGVALDGHHLRVVPLRAPWGHGVVRKLLLPMWVLRSRLTLAREIRRADVVHTPIPGDVGTIGIVVAEAFRKPLLVRHCGDWRSPRTTAEKLWKWYMERFAGGRRSMLATGMSDTPPSDNPAVRWIFSTAMDASDLADRGGDRTLDPRRPLRLVTVGRQLRAKGTATAIRSLPLLRDRVPQGITLDIVGDGPDLAEFQRVATELAVADLCTFHGQVPHSEALDLIDSADLLVFPTESFEGFPKVVAEAMALGVPAITTAVSTLPELVGAGGGLIVEPAATAVAEAVLLMGADVERYARASSAACSIARNFTLDSWKDGLRLEITRVLEAPKRDRPAGRRALNARHRR